MTDLTIGKLAKEAGVHVETIRYYQRLGLIQEPPKPATGYRRYPEEEVARLRFIKRAQKIGFSLQEIAELFALGERHCADVQTLAQQKQMRIHRQIEELQAISRILDELIAQCDVSRESAHCALIDILNRNSDS